MTNGTVRRWVLGAAAVAMLAVMASVGMAQESVFDKKLPSDQNDIIYGGRGVSGTSGVAAVCSFIVPGLGQAVNGNQGKKIIVHLVIGLLPLIAYVNPAGAVFAIFHIWSAWDALIDRRGGYIDGTVSAPAQGLDAGLRGTPANPVC